MQSSKQTNEKFVTKFEVDHAFFTRSSAIPSYLLNKKEQHEKDLMYICDIKAQRKCYNCHKFGHWLANCLKPKRKRPDSHNLITPSCD